MYMFPVWILEADRLNMIEQDGMDTYTSFV